MPCRFGASDRTSRRVSILIAVAPSPDGPLGRGSTLRSLIGERLAPSTKSQQAPTHLLPRVWAPPPRLTTAPLGLGRPGPFSLNGGRFLFCTLPVSYCVSSVTN